MSNANDMPLKDTDDSWDEVAQPTEGRAIDRELDKILTGVVHIETKENTDCYVEPACEAVFDKPKVKEALLSLIAQHTNSVLQEVLDKLPGRVLECPPGCSSSDHDQMEGYNTALADIKQIIEGMKTNGYR